MAVLRHKPDEYILAIKPIKRKCLREGNITSLCLTWRDKVMTHLGIKSMLRLKETRFFSRMDNSI